MNRVETNFHLGTGKLTMSKQFVQKVSFDFEGSSNISCAKFNALHHFSVTEFDLQNDKFNLIYERVNLICKREYVRARKSKCINL